MQKEGMLVIYPRHLVFNYCIHILWNYAPKRINQPTKCNIMVNQKYVARI